MPNKKKDIMQDGYYADAGLSELSPHQLAIRESILATQSGDYDTGERMARKAERINPSSIRGDMMVNRARAERRRKAVKHGY